MFIKVFVLGRPGSGKTTAVHHLLEAAQRRNVLTLTMDDYNILYHMSRHEAQCHQFRETDYGGFDVLDPTVFDTALQILEQKVRMATSSQQNGIITIEFARNDYRDAFSKFQPDFLEDAYVLFVDADLKTCIQRIHQRVTTPLVPDGHFVSDYVMERYYSHDNWSYISTQLQSEHHIGKMVKAFRNTGSLSLLFSTIDEFIEHIIRTEFAGHTLHPRKIREEKAILTQSQVIVCS